MDLKKYQPIIEVLVVSFLLYLAHKVVFFFHEKNPNFQNFHFSIETMYGFFLFCSLIIVSVLILVKEKNIDHVGYTFLLITFIKMGISYMVLLPILRSESVNIETEKTNFFIVFALFLTVETIITIRLLNKKP